MRTRAGLGIGTVEGVLGAFCEGFSGFFCVFEVFWKFFEDFLTPVKRSD